MGKHKKYKPYETVQIVSREWSNRQIIKAPIWASSDLRDGNQALAKPMGVWQKIAYFKNLIALGIREIEIAYPSASQIEFDFCRRLIEQNLIPNGVKVGVLTPAIEKHILRSFEALDGAENIIMHLYNPTAANQRETVFKKTKSEIIDLAIIGTKIIKERAKSFAGNVTFEYSPESFSQTELDFAKEISDAVIAEWNPRKNGEMILNLPNTLEACTPNVYADRIEWMRKNLKDANGVILSVHPHNDRGTAVASAELAMLAGAGRVEGTLLGNGERAGNVDLITLAFNLYSSGVNPELNLENIDEILKEVCEISGLNIAPRHPYVGAMIYTAFSGTHQDAIKKGVDEMKQKSDEFWEVPYLPIDPKDIKREYKDLIRINSQSGKGGVAFVLKEFYGIDLSVEELIFLAKEAQKLADDIGAELGAEDILRIYNEMGKRF